MIETIIIDDCFSAVLDNASSKTVEFSISDKVYVLIIYDIVSTRRTNKLVRFLQGYGFRVQKSAFEAVIRKRQFQEIMQKMDAFIDEKEDSVRIYQIIGKGHMFSFGVDTSIPAQEEVIVV